MMGITTLYSTEKTAEQIGADLIKKSGKTNPKVVIFFASSSLDPASISKSMEKTFPKASVFGCTTAGEIVSGKMLSNSVVAMLLDDEIIEDLSIQTIANISSQNNILHALGNISNHFNESITKLDITKYVGIILIDGLSKAEEKVMDEIGNHTNITFVGGAAGDDLHFKKTFVFNKGKALSDSAVIAVLKLKRGFDIIKTQSFCTTGKKLQATKVNESSRRVVQFNGLPAVKAYSEAMGCSEAMAVQRFMSNPLGLLVDDEPYIRSPQRIENNDIIFYCTIKEGMVLDLMSSTDIVNDTKTALRNKLTEIGTISGIIDFHCILRTLELRQKNQCDQYGAIFSEIPTIGFSTYGEEYIGHINQTSTMLVFK